MFTGSREREGRVMKQWTELSAKVNFSLKFEGRGRACLVKIGDIFIVTNPEHAQNAGVKVARKRIARLNEGYLLNVEQITTLFEEIPE